MTMPMSPPMGTGAMEAHGIYQQLIPYSPGSPSQEQIAQLQESIKSQMEGQAAFLMHQMRNEQAASVIKMSEMNMTQMHQFSEEMKKAAQASREQELRQEKLLQMLVQMKEEQAKADPAASSRAMPPPAAIPVCKCGKPAERLQVKEEESPRKGRWFWKCMQRQCDYFEWEMEEVDLLSETTKTAGSKNPRRSKSPRRDLRSSGPIPPTLLTAVPRDSWTRVTGRESVINVDQEEDL